MRSTDRLIISIWKESEESGGFDESGGYLEFIVQGHFRNFVSKHAQISPIDLAKRDFAKYRVDYASAFLVEWIRAQWFVNRYLVHVTARPLARPAPR